MKRFLSLVTVFILLVMAITGCGGTAGQQGTTAAGSTAAVSTTIAATTSAPADISIFLMAHPTDLTTIDDMPWTLYVNNLLNVKLHWTFAQGDVYNERLSTLLASGDVPDLVNTLSATANVYGAQGVFLKTDDLIKQYGPHLQELLDKKVSSVLRDNKGDLYVVSSYNLGAIYPWWGIDYRKDILDKWGMKEPETPAQWYDALKKYKSENPAGVGLIVQGSVASLVRPFETAFDIARADGSWDELFSYTDNTFTKLEFLPTTDKFKASVEFLAKLYKDDLINKDFATIDTTNWWSQITSGKVFSWASSFARSSAAREDAAKAGVTMNTAVALYPADQNGEKHIGMQQVPWQDYYSFAISSKSKVVKEAMSVLDWASSPEGSAMKQYGLEGETWKKEGNKIVPIPLDAKAASDLWNKNGGGYGYPCYWMCRVDSEEAVFGGNATWTEYIDGSKNNMALVTPTPSFNVKDPEAQKELDGIKTEVNNYMTQAVFEFVMGKRPMSKWDEYVKGFEALKSSRAVEIEQKALDDYYTMVGK